MIIILVALRMILQRKQTSSTRRFAWIVAEEWRRNKLFAINSTAGNWKWNQILTIFVFRSVWKTKMIRGTEALFRRPENIIFVLLITVE